MNETTQNAPTLYYDGGCPVCSREIAMYQRQPGADRVQWVDVTRCEPHQLGQGLTPDAALQRLHLRLPDGRLVSGAAAFTSLWRNLPRWAWLGRLLGTPATLWVLEGGYRAFLVLRRGWRRT
ncbi:MAG: thiol-disulfide oxidoreductase DCC family protein [Hydrogenophaga sp.]|uniref:thiol-disulfide oxidoreductase DCC family protein n=1 Tax=Hydrogenophaga sp. TaxID=1904254 RepID=UPI003D9B3725